MTTAYEDPFHNDADRRLYVRLPDGRHWRWTCPTCGRSGRGEGHHRAVQNLAAHCRKYHQENPA